MKLIYILSNERSGSTILDMLVSNHEKIESVGEIRLLEDHLNKKAIGESWDWKCTCNKQIPECDFWSSILTSEEITSGVKTKIVSESNLFPLFFSSKKGRLKNKNIASNITGLYKRIFKKKSLKYIVDSSKKNFNLFFLKKRIKHNNILVLNLKRDCRAVAFSKLKRTNDDLSGLTVIAHLILWFLRQVENNLLTFFYFRQNELKVEYEELCKNTEKVIGDIYKKLGLEFDSVDTTLDHRDKHNIAGTPSRFSFNKTAVEYQDDWRNYINLKNTPFSYFLGALFNKLT